MLEIAYAKNIVSSNAKRDRNNLNISVTFLENYFGDFSKLRLLDALLRFVCR